jgi:hypothetical protein
MTVKRQLVRSRQAAAVDRHAPIAGRCRWSGCEINRANSSASVSLLFRAEPFDCGSVGEFDAAHMNGDPQPTPVAGIAPR